MSQPFVERNRNNLNQFVSFVEGRINKNRPSTHLNTGLVDMFVDNFGTQGHTTQLNKENGYDAMEVDVDYDNGGGYDNDDDNVDDYVNDLSRRRQKRAPAPWDDLENVARVVRYTGDEDLPVSRKAVKAYARDPPTPMEVMKRKNRREEKIGKSRRDEFMETHDYLQDYYYWRSAARINPGKDWKVEALRAAILKEKKRRVKEKTARIREARGQLLAPKRRTTRAGIAMENFEAVLEDVELVPQNNRRTLGAECKLKMFFSSKILLYFQTKTLPTKILLLKLSFPCWVDTFSMTKMTCSHEEKCHLLLHLTTSKRVVRNRTTRSNPIQLHLNISHCVSMTSTTPN